MIIENFKRIQYKIVALVIAGGLGYSVNLQLNMNAFNFFVYFEVQGSVFPKAFPTYKGKEVGFKRFHDQEVDDFFFKTHYGKINGAFLDYMKSGKTPMALEHARKRLIPSDFQKFEMLLRARLTSNYYWFAET